MEYHKYAHINTRVSLYPMGLRGQTDKHSFKFKVNNIYIISAYCYNFI